MTDQNAEQHVEGYIGQVDDDQGDYRTEIRIYKGDTSDEDIQSDYQYPDGTGPCQCSHCFSGRDCCGSWTAGSISILRDDDKDYHPLMVIQSWSQNV